MLFFIKLNLHNLYKSTETKIKQKNTDATLYVENLTIIQLQCKFELILTYSPQLILIRLSVFFYSLGNKPE